MWRGNWWINTSQDDFIIMARAAPDSPYFINFNCLYLQVMLPRFCSAAWTTWSLTCDRQRHIKQQHHHKVMCIIIWLGKFRFTVYINLYIMYIVKDNIMCVYTKNTSLIGLICAWLTHISGPLPWPRLLLFVIAISISSRCSQPNQVLPWGSLSAVCVVAAAGYI